MASAAAAATIAAAPSPPPARPRESDRDELRGVGVALLDRDETADSGDDTESPPAEQGLSPRLRLPPRLPLPLRRAMASPSDESLPVRP